MTQQLQRILLSVQKPARYTGGEWGEVKKNLEDVRVRIAFCFPDTYEIGMSNVGMRILYGVMNEMEGVWCERVFAPWTDMEEMMRQKNLPLWALESQDPVKDFDMIAFTIGYEMAYSNVLNMLNLAGVPLRAKDRKDLKNMVFAGGVCTFNPEPLAEGAAGRVCRLFLSGRRRGNHGRDRCFVRSGQGGGLGQGPVPSRCGENSRCLCPQLLPA